MSSDLTVKWLGISGVELRFGGETILIDPVFSRVRFTRVLFGSVVPDEAAVRRHAPPCDAIFITHAHHDHLMDAPAISTLTGAAIYGPANACAIAGAYGARGEKLHTIGPGDTVNTTSFTVTALPASHLRLPGYGRGRPARRLSAPLRARQYRMDESMVFLVEAGGYRLLVGPGLCLMEPGPVDALLCCPIYLGKKLQDYVGRLHPGVFIPIHWEDMFRSVRKPLRPGLIPKLPLHRVDMAKVAEQVLSLGVVYFAPKMGQEYLLSDLLRLQ